MGKADILDNRKTGAQDTKPCASTGASKPAVRTAAEAADSHTKPKASTAASKPVVTAASKIDSESYSTTNVAAVSSAQENEVTSGKLSALKSRLQEIDKLRAELDKEELTLRREIMKLERAEGRS